MNETQTYRGGGDPPPSSDAPTRIDLPTDPARIHDTPQHPSGTPGAVGGAPLAADDGTGASADPTDARLVHQPMPWAMGILNVLFSAVLAVVWLWIPVGLFVSGVAGVFALGFGIIFLLVWFLLQRGINHLERLRSEAVYGERIRVPQTRTTLRTGFGGWLHQQWLILTSAAFWRSTVHSFVKTLYGGTIGILLLAGLGFGTFALALSINPTFLATSDVTISSRAGLGVLGGAAIVVALLILGVSPILDRLIDRGLLPSTRAAALRAERDSLTHEVGALETARTGAVDAATAERLRIERDLHDGVQPMLVALSMKLGMARRKLDTDPDAGKDLVAEAHQDSKDAITELRNLARGIHPAVLEDRGLDAAISALAARSPVPVTVDVQVPERVSAEAESVSYFVVAESLTNIAKHARAQSARVSVRAVNPDRLQIVVVDDGAGGARIDRGGSSTGLAGLDDRIAAARGTLSVTSPVGGPTTIVAEVPCAS
ncbi:sensor histidine kinase [Brevibacterium senegalense]|uniref:sensor histidine kinase n=1 Tax=Brevibacterium senegalense TaxID=1033736 RepID=UPI0002ED2A59|nr:sensor histidine kinase [Brevibacterium senegalense]